MDLSTIITSIISQIVNAAITQPLTTLMSSLIVDMVNQNNDFTVSLFSNSMVTSFILLVTSVAGCFFLFGVGFAFASWAIDSQENGGVNVSATFKNCFIGLAATMSIGTLPILLLSSVNDLAGILSNALISASGTSFSDLWNTKFEVLSSLNFFSGWGSPIFIIITFICTVRIFLANLKRGGIMITLMVVGSLHMFSVPRGYTEAFFSWCKQVAGLCVTSFMQNILLVLGLAVYLNSDVDFFDVILAGGVMLSATEVPRILQQFGLDTSMKANVSQAIFGVSGVMNIVGSFAR